MLTWPAHAGAVTSVAFVPGGGLLSTGTDGVLKHWDAATGSLRDLRDLSAAGQDPAECYPLRVLVDAAGRSAVAALGSGGVRFYDLDGLSQVADLPLAALYGIAAGPGGASVFVLATGNVRSQRWPAADPVAVVEYRFEGAEPVAWSRHPPGGVYYGLAVSPDGAQVVASRTRYAWPSGEMTGPASLATGSMFAVSPDGDKLFGASGARLMVWGMQTGALRRKLKGHLATITGLSTTPDGRKLWTASADATVRRWDVETYRCETCYALKVGPLGCVAVSPDGLTAAAGSAHTGHVAVWDLD